MLLKLLLFHLEHDHNGRIIRKIEMVQGREPRDLQFVYEEHENVPYAAILNNAQMLYLFYDQVGLLRVVADEYNRVIKEVRYSAFGVIEEDTNPVSYMPIGFAAACSGCPRPCAFARPCLARNESSR